MSNTEKLELYTPQHYLLNADDMSIEALAVVSDSDMDEYEEEHAIYLAKQKDSVSTVHTLYKESEKNLAVIFGEYSNEHKYLKRAIHKGGALTDIHSKQIPLPSSIRSKVEDARNKVDVSSLHTSSTVSDNGLLEINHALEYLVNNGLKLNKDFTLTNAVAVAKSHKGTQVMARVVLDDWELNIEGEEGLIFIEDKCDADDCSANYDVYSDSDSSDLKLRCCCGSKKYSVDFAFAEGGESTTVLS
jgi:dsDNA-binding SOS-regulon protein